MRGENVKFTKEQVDSWRDPEDTNVIFVEVGSILGLRIPLQEGITHLYLSSLLRMVARRAYDAGRASKRAELMRLLED